MRPFDLSKHSSKESFKIDYHKDEWEAGNFDYQFTTYESLSKPQLNLICKWLSENCTENFIITRDVRHVLAGGYADNRTAWKYRKRYGHKAMSDIRIRLYQVDVMLFRMTWLP